MPTSLESFATPPTRLFSDEIITDPWGPLLGSPVLLVPLVPAPCVLPGRVATLTQASLPSWRLLCLLMPSPAGFSLILGSLVSHEPARLVPPVDGGLSWNLAPHPAGICSSPCTLLNVYLESQVTFAFLDRVTLVALLGIGGEDELPLPCLNALSICPFHTVAGS